MAKGRLSELFGELGRIKARSAKRSGRRVGERRYRSTVIDARVALVRARQAQIEREKDQ
jgi:hypothetical protein